jgi:NADH-quinone oxidoreductase subunit G
VSYGPVREEKHGATGIHVQPGGEMAAVESLRDRLKSEGDLVILFGGAIQGGELRKLIAFGDSLGIPVKYVCLLDYSNSRGAFDMGLVPRDGGMSREQMLDAPDLDVLWVVGANPLKNAALASAKAFVVVQDLFMTETAKHADIVLPAASAYEKNGTVTNTCGEVQKLRAAIKVMGAKTDLEIMGLIAKEMGLDLGIWLPEKMFEELCRSVRGYNVPLPIITAGGAAATAPLNGRVAALPGNVASSGDTLFTSGTLGRYSNVLHSVIEAPGALYRGEATAPRPVPPGEVIA